MTDISRLHARIWQIYDILEKHRCRRDDRAAFKQSCSALDAIGDTCLALDDFVSCDASFSTGITYILAYGVLQAVFLQQDALKHLAVSLSLPIETPEALREIRELRNEAVGHPTGKKLDKDGGIISFHHIARVTLSKEGFQLLTTYSNIDVIDSKDVDLHRIVRTQMSYTSQFLSEILEKLKQEQSIGKGEGSNQKP
jgi:hypothetical protein